MLQKSIRFYLFLITLCGLSCSKEVGRSYSKQGNCSVKIPVGWEELKTKKQEALSLREKVSEAGGETEALFTAFSGMRKRAQAKMSSEEFTDFTMTFLERRIGDLEFIDEGTRPLAGKSADWYRYKTSDDHDVMIYILQNDREFFLLLAAAEEKRREDLQPVYESILDSFRFE